MCISYGIMFVQTGQTPNPNTLKFIPGKKVSEVGPVEFISQKQGVQNLLCHYVPEVKRVETT